MNKLLETINNDLKDAMRAREEKKLLVLRMLTSSLKNKRIEKGRDAELTDEDVVATIKSEVKKRNDSIEAYTEGNRDDLVKNEEEEKVILEKYMPEQLSVEEVEKTVREIVQTIKPQGPQDFGKVMGAAMGKLKGQVDGGVVGDIVKKVLAE